jgi:hypothetical protein
LSEVTRSQCQFEINRPVSCLTTVKIGCIPVCVCDV